MKKHSYGKLIDMSWRWMKQILLRPFSLKKWIMLAVIIILAGQMGGNFNINISGSKADFEKFINKLIGRPPTAALSPPSFEISDTLVKSGTVETSQTVPELFTESKTPPFLINAKTATYFSLIAILALLLISIYILLWMWIRANFAFVFIDSIVRNDASFRVPFHRNKAQGNSYLKWNIVFGSIVALALGIIISLPVIQMVKLGFFTGPAPIDANRILSMVLRYIPLFSIVLILLLLVMFFTNNFVLPIMYKKRIGILKAWKAFLGLLKRNIGEIGLYLLVKIGLSILAIAIAIVLFILGILAFLLVGGLTGLLGWLIYAITPGAAKLFIIVVLILAGIPFFVFLGFLFNMLFIPFPIFFRTFSIYVLGSMDESLDLFAEKTPEELAADGGDEKYKKSMALVWFTVLAPIIVIVMGIVLAIAIPNFVKVKERGLPKDAFGIEKIIPFRKMPTRPGAAPQRTEPSGKAVTVYLNNGNSFEAEILRESEQNIAFRIEGGTFILPRSDILRIEGR